MWHRSLKRWLKRAALRCALAAALVLFLINGAVRVIGRSDPFWLSPFRLRDKTRALGSLVLHVPRIFKRNPGLPALIKRAAQKHKVPADLVLAVAKTESRLKRYRISRTGAMGVMQLMPDTADFLKVGDPFDPEQNIDGGARYLASLYKRYRGDIRRVAAAYNAGPGRVPRRGPMSLPGETRHYVRKVLQAMKSPNDPR